MMPLLSVPEEPVFVPPLVWLRKALKLPVSQNYSLQDLTLLPLKVVLMLLSEICMKILGNGTFMIQ